MQLTETKAALVLCLLSTCCTGELVTMHIGIAKMFRAQGARVVVLLTDGDCCTYFTTLGDASAEKCARECTDAFERLQNAGVEVRRVSEFHPPTGSAGPFYSIDDKSDGADPRMSELWPIVRASVVRHCAWMTPPRDDLPLTASEVNIAQQYLVSAKRYVTIFRDVMAEFRPTHLLVFNGIFYLERIASEAAFHVGARVFVTESSSFWNRRVFGEIELGQGIRESLRMRVPETFKLSELQRRRLGRFLKKVYTGKNNWTRQQRTGATPLTSPGGGKRIALFLSQVPYDSVITEDALVPSIPSVIDQVISVFDRLADWNLIIRLHPIARDRGDYRDPLAEWLDAHPLRERFTLVRGLEMSTYDLMEQAALGITVSSQSGLEMLGKNRTVVVLGSAFYRGTGATIDRATGESISKAIERGVANVLGEAERRRAEAVVYYWIFRYLTAFSRRRGEFLPRGRRQMRQLFAVMSGIRNASEERGPRG